MEQLSINSKDKNRFFRRRYNATAVLAAGLLLFMLPFASIKCGTVKIAENTGIGMAIGQQWKVSFSEFDKGMFSDIGEVTGSAAKKGRPQWFVVFAAFFALCGLIVSISYWEMRAVITMSASILASVLLGGAYFHLKMQLRSMPFDSGELSGINFIKLSFTAWYYLSLVFFVAAAIFSYKHHRIELEDKLAAATLFDFQHENETTLASEEQGIR